MEVFKKREQFSTYNGKPDLKEIQNKTGKETGV